MAAAIPAKSEPGPPAFPSAVLDSPDVQTFLSGAARDLLEETGGAGRGFLWAIARIGPGEVRPWASGSVKAGEVDGMQNPFADGPAVTAAASREFVHIPDAAADRRWPGFSAAVVGQGVRSVLCVPVALEREFSAALTLYAPSPHAFTSDDVVRAVACAQRLSDVCRLLLDLARTAGDAETQTPLSVTELAAWRSVPKPTVPPPDAAQGRAG